MSEDGCGEKNKLKENNKTVIAGTGYLGIVVVSYVLANVDHTIPEEFILMLGGFMGSVFTWLVWKIRNHAPELGDAVETFLDYFKNRGNKDTENGKESKQ